MNLKTLLFDNIISKGIIKADLKRHWMTPVVIGVLYLMFIYPQISMLRTHDQYISDFGDSILYTDSGFFAYSAAFILAGMFFSYLHKPAPVSFMHGIPVTRTQLFFSHWLTGIVLILVPVTVLSLILGSIGAYGGEYFLATTSMVFLIYSIVTAVSMAVGNRFAAYIFSAALMILPLYIMGITDYYFNENVYGYVGNYEILTVLYKDFSSLSEPLNFVTYIILSIVFTALAFVLYKFRDLENSNEMIAFSWIRPIFVFITAFCFSSFAYMISSKSIVVAFIIGFVAVAISFMLIKKSVTFKGSSVYILSYIILFAVIFIGSGFAANFMNKAPGRMNIREAYLGNSNAYYSFFSSRNLKDPDKITLNDNEIQMLLDIQNDVIETRKKNEYDYNTSPSVDLSFAYDLNIGGKICRRYEVSEELIKKHKDFFNTESYAKYKFGFITVDSDNIDSISISKSPRNGESFSLAENKTAAIVEAFKKDVAEHIADGTFYDMAVDFSYNNNDYQYQMDINYSWGADQALRSNYVYIPNSFKNTIKEIEKSLERF